MFISTIMFHLYIVFEGFKKGVLTVGDVESVVLYGSVFLSF